ncbi:MAG: arginine--tRNA ligase [Acetobacteraceae bacterium]|nr:arginine--tRNA ligase [Acetobacteraceae bacterium]MSP30584.1 arginine--tRNA ligase [Acetobacteraceae bacterium]
MSLDIFAGIRLQMIAALRAIVPDLPDDIAARVEVTPSREAAHGDMATNAALLAAKLARQPPALLAAALVERLVALEDVAEASAAGPGFVNLRLHPDAWRAVLPDILVSGENFGDSVVGGGTRVNVEYVSANPTGPMHIGHCRGAVVGDALANLLAKAGFDVTKEYYINDAGAQVAALAWAAYFRYLQALGTKITEEEFSEEVPGGLQYRGEYLVGVGVQLVAQFAGALADHDTDENPIIAAPDIWLETVRAFTVAAMMDGVRADLRLLGVELDVFTSERAMVASGAVDTAIAKLDADGLIYEGVLEPPKGKTPDDWEPREQTLFRSTGFGDDVDRPLRKSDGANTYFANDIAYHADKIDRGYTVMIDVWGADHGGYVKRMQAAVKAISGNTVTLDVVLCQIVHIMRGGQPVRMSKRAGTYVTLSDLIEEVGPDAVRFTMLTRKSDAQMEFDLDQVRAQTRENPVFYVQYAHARCRSVLRAAVESLGAEAVSADALARSDLSPLAAPEELALIRRLAGWPRIVEAAALAREPHRIAFALYDLAGDFHALWNRGRNDATLRFLQAGDPGSTLARLALVAATATVIRSGLAVMGVRPVEEMR